MNWRRRLAWAVGSVLVLWALAWAAVPPLLKWQLQERASQALGRAVTVGAVRFWPWSLELVLDDVAVAGAAAIAPAQEPLLEVAHVHVDVDMASLWRLAPVIAALEIEAPRLRLARTGTGRYDIDDLLARFAPRAEASADEPARFALYNVQLRDVQVRFDDRPAGRVHTLAKGMLTLPFVSNLPSQVQVNVEPRLAFTLNGSPFDSGAQATPFASERQGTLRLAFEQLDVAPYLPYWPEALPVRLQRGLLAAELNLRFDQPPGGTAIVVLQGRASAREFAVSDRAGVPLLAWAGLDVDVRDLQPLQRRVALGTLRVGGLQLHVRRDAKGEFNLAQLGAGASPGGASSGDAAASPWQASLDALQLDGAALLWNDAAVSPAVAWRLADLALSAKDLRWPLAQPVPWKLSAALQTQADSAAMLARFALDGTALADQAQFGWQVDALRLEAFAPYLAPVFKARLAGRLAAAGRLDWSTAPAASKLELKVDAATLDTLQVGAADARDGLKLARAELAQAHVDLVARHATVGQLALLQPSLGLVRDDAGQWNVLRWTAGAAAASAPDQPPARAAAAAPSAAWRLTLGELAIDGGALRLSDARPAQRALESPVRLALAGLRLRVRDLAWPGERDGMPTRVQAALRMGSDDGTRAPALTGALNWTGRIGTRPLQARGALRADRLPLHLVEPYLGDALPVSLLRAEASGQGELTVREAAQGWAVDASADVRLTDVRLHARTDSQATGVVAGDELLSWQSLALQGVRVALKPAASPRVEIGETTLTDFYARLVVTEQGRFNLQDLAAAPAPAASAAAAASASAASPAAPLPAAAASAPLLELVVGSTRLVNGRIDFSDRFVRPNYSANLTELNGRLGAFRSGTRDMATLELRGRAAGTALLDITGALNPTADPLALDIRARATDLELAPLSPYAGKYAGYAIERGKLSMDVAYKIDADGKLDAKNQIVLNQLTFGDKVDSPDATKLPVLLAVALLKDRNGVIDINLPVSGSINDPKFSVGGIIVKVIVNLLVKVFTAPFSLLAGGGTDDLSLVEFRAGTTLTNEAGQRALDKVAKALTDRPALKMTVTGAADPVSEREAYQSAVLESRLVAERRRELLRAGGSADVAVALAAEDRARLLRDLYRATDIPNKPRNAIGLQRDIPGPEMEALLKSRLIVTEDAMRELALQRGLAVRDALIALGLPSERLFVAAPRVRAATEGDAAWTPRVQLSLSTR